MQEAVRDATTCFVKQAERPKLADCEAAKANAVQWNEGLVEPRGIEPLTSALRTRRSPS